ncbi:MAG: LCP family protein [Elusimicrobiota bacterium]
MLKKSFDRAAVLWLVRGSFVGLLLLAFYFSWSSPVWSRLSAGRPIQGLILGCDWVDHSVHTDTMVFFSYNPRSRKLNLLAIPRDTQINLTDTVVGKINQVYGAVYKKTESEKEAAQSTLNTVSSLLGGIDLPFYLQVGYEGFRALIDLVGGIKVTIGQPMKYDDNWGNLHINFSPGEYLLDGRKSLEYVRYRDERGDLGRIGRQQRFLRKFLNKFKNPWLVWRLPGMYSLYRKNINTNLSWIDFLGLVYEVKNLNKDNIQAQILPGKPSKSGRTSYWLADAEKVGRAMNLVSSPVVQGLAEKSALPVQVEVWNASRKSGAARKAAFLLRRNGFDVIKWGGLERKEGTTSVIDLRGNFAAAQAIGKVLGTEEVITQIDTNPVVDIIVVIGEDFNIQ